MISELAKWSAGEHTSELYCQRSTAGDCCGQPWARHIAPPEELNHCLGCSAPAYEKALRCSWAFVFKSIRYSAARPAKVSTGGADASVAASC